MRKILVLAFLGAACAVASLFPLQKSGAQKAQLQDVPTEPRIANSRALPDFDIRLDDSSEFVDEDISSVSMKQQGLRSNKTAAKASAVDEQLRAGLNTEDKHNLRAVLNDAGAMKNLFVEGGALSEAQSDSADNVARGFLKTHNELFALTTADVANLQLTKEDNDQGTSFIDYVQTVGGLKVFEGQVQVVVNKYGQVVNVREGFLVDQPPAKLKASLSEQKAIVKALEYSGRTVFPSFAETQSRASRGDTARFANPIDLAFEEITSELNVVRVGDESRLAWHVYAEVGPEEWYEILVDAQNGDLLLRHNIYVFEAQGTVYTEAPDKGARVLVSFVGDTTINTPAGWMGTSTVTTGNNVEAYLDTDANNAPDPNNGSGLSNGHASAANQDFTFPFSTTVDPRTQQAAVVTNLFYYNNIMHDFSYRLGFTESARNFQVDNFGRGGLGADSVRAEAQDGSGTNNANFATPPDGSRPRMQQFLFTAPTPDRDSSVDGDVVFHEYGHGISNRLIGNGSTALSGTKSREIGEVWYDYCATTINNDGAVGEYVTNNPNGIRRAVYSVPAAAVHDSYADVGAGGFEVHRDGEVWAATLWDLRTQLGAALSDRLVLHGMKFTPNRPSFLNARDGILQADQDLNAGANRCAIWTVFARHGMGVSAVGNDGTTHIAATDVPTDCGGTCTFSVSPTSANYPATGGTGSVTVTTGVGCNWTAVSNDNFITITAGASGSGNGVVNYSVAANTLSSPRSGSMLIAGINVAITQDGAVASCPNALTNPGFESGTAPWVISGQAVRSTGSFPHS